jgi:hypothetical protein
VLPGIYLEDSRKTAKTIQDNMLPGRGLNPVPSGYHSECHLRCTDVYPETTVTCGYVSNSSTVAGEEHNVGTVRGVRSSQRCCLGCYACRLINTRRRFVRSCRSTSP